MISKSLMMLSTAALVCFYLLASVAPAAADPEKDGTEASAMVKGDDPNKYKENLDSIPYMVAAYALIWAGLFVYIFSIQKRQGAVQADIAELREHLQRWDEKQGTSE